MTKMPWSLLTEGSAHSTVIVNREAVDTASDSVSHGQEDCCLAVGRGQPRYSVGTRRRYQKIDIVVLYMMDS